MANRTLLPKIQSCLTPSNPKSNVIPITGKCPSQAQGSLLCMHSPTPQPPQCGLLFGIGPRDRFCWYIPHFYPTLNSLEPSVQDLNDESYWSFTFVDDSWLLVLRDGTEPSTGPQGLIFLNSKQAPLTQTTFCYDPSEYVGMAVRDLVSDPGGYRPSPEDERFAPFYPDPSQRVFVVETTDYAGFLVMKTEVLLRLAQEREGEDLRWEEWGAYMTRISRNQEITSLWVSGPLLFCVYSAGSEETMMDVYDFSARASARYAKMVEGGSAARYEPSITQILPWRIDEIADSYGCHDSITFVMVKISPFLKPDPRLTCCMLGD